MSTGGGEKHRLPLTWRARPAWRQRGRVAPCLGGAALNRGAGAGRGLGRGDVPKRRGSGDRGPDGDGECDGAAHLGGGVPLRGRGAGQRDPRCGPAIDWVRGERRDALRSFEKRRRPPTGRRLGLFGGVGCVAGGPGCSDRWRGDGCRRRGNSTHDIAAPRQSKRRCLTSPAAMLSSLLASPPTVSRCPAVPAARWLPSSSFSPESGARSRQPPLALPRQCRRVGRRSINRICRRATQPVQSGPSQPNACLYSLDGSYS